MCYILQPDWSLVNMQDIIIPNFYVRPTLWLAKLSGASVS